LALNSVNSTTFQIDVSSQISQPGCHKIAVQVFWGDVESKRLPNLVLFCQPGGAMNRHYFSLLAEEDYSHSFAHYMAASNKIVVTMDHLGVGESSVPTDGFGLTLEVLAAANHAAVVQTCALLFEGNISDTLPALAHIKPIGIGHSMGAMLTVVQQERHKSYKSLILLGFSNQGLPDMLTDEEKFYIDNAEKTRRNARKLAEQYFSEPYVGEKKRELPPGASKNNSISDIAKQAVAKTKAPLLAVGGMMSLIPGSIRPEMESITVPIFLGLGDRDLIKNPHAVPAEFPECSELALLVLRDTGHNHFLCETRFLLFERIAYWIES